MKENHLQKLMEMRTRYIYHITHKDNLKNILDNGLLSHNNNLVKNRIDNPEVNERRDRDIDISGKNLHDYVPFYFNPRNPMLYVRKNIQDDLIILVFDGKLIHKRRSLFTDGNAASDDTKFFNNPKDLNKLNWSCIRSKYWDNCEDGKRIIMSEVLIPKKVNIKHLKKIYINNQDTKNYVDNLINNIQIESKINRREFFKG